MVAPDGGMEGYSPLPLMLAHRLSNMVSILSEQNFETKSHSLIKIALPGLLEQFQGRNGSHFH